ncbi:gamma-glutamylcyclotransferase [Texcoconibacillus texcoconensis]|uniref:Gamma-glutamylcyclotransferase (GGCT)/AIG2-like uncharacterized protein YtfP n=1 Tax=Texcoconibacillus texcoconensis TaxID=1095777 RepID=A0A840QLT7_9BACI|nr:gamma-glutamylcyclotransferase family protein [Texcoconibacillus texcoconensis]MBB5172316.1 gamma-glutamylcyclotransferase (GGCT)/AIG2-like uncharacterized protein YtfP [Texcoconibacillus texcoconensis]
MTKLFVYGTLLPNQPNEHYLEEATLLHEQARIKGEMFDTDLIYPTLVMSGTSHVYGHVYDVPERLWGPIDELEGYTEEEEDRMYDRSIETVETDQGNIEAYVYHVRDRERFEETYPIASGDWKVYKFQEDKPDHFYFFAYGSAMDDERFKKAGVESYFQDVQTVGTLKGYEMRYKVHANDGGRADIIETNNDEDRVEGIVYQCPIDALDYLYNREGVESGIYRPALVDVVGENGETLKDVITFIVVNKEEEIAPPDHYAEEILRGAKGRVSEKYYEKLSKQIETLQQNKK